MSENLQWSHDYLVVETDRHYDMYRRGSRLQWSHDYLVVETRRDLSVFLGEHFAFNGATTI